MSRFMKYHNDNEHNQTADMSFRKCGLQDKAASRDDSRLARAVKIFSLGIDRSIAFRSICSKKLHFFAEILRIVEVSCCKYEDQSTTRVLAPALAPRECTSPARSPKHNEPQMH